MTLFALNLKFKEVIVNLYVNMLANSSSSFLCNWGHQLGFASFRYGIASYIITEVSERI